MDPTAAGSILYCNDTLSDRVLTVRLCNMKPVLCINCTDPCGSDNNYCSENFVAPCQTHVGCPTDLNYLKMYTTKYKLNSIFVLPTLLSTTSTATTTSVSVDFTYSDDGFVTCGLFDGEISDLVPLMTNGVEKEIEAGSVHFNFNGLHGSSNYYLYCRLETMDGRETSLEQVLGTLQVIQTSCCKAIVVQMISDDFPVTPVMQNVFDIVIQTQPSASVQIHIRISNYSDSGEPLPYQPSSFSVDSTMMYPLTTSIYVNTSMLYPVASRYEVNLILSGLSANDFGISFASNNTFYLQSPTVIPNPPVLKSSRYSRDASYIVVTFDSDTDRGSLGSALMPASVLFSFVGAPDLDCQWIDDRTVYVYLAGKSLCPLGSEIILLENTVKAKCRTTPGLEPCELWSFAASTRVYVELPLDPITPTLQIMMPDTIGECTDLTIDLSASTGSGGRAWTFFVDVFSSDTNDISALTSYLVTMSSSYLRPIVIQSSYLSPDVYSFVITICNFLGSCTSSQKRVVKLESNIPIVSIAGPPTRTYTRSKALVIRAFASIRNCSGDATTSGISYSWSIYKDGILLDLISSSRQLNVFRLPAYTLPRDYSSSYVVKVTVVDDESLMSAAATTTVLLVAGELRAIIGGGSHRTIRVGELVQLNGSQSYDKDMQSANDGLQYLWSCIQTYPSFSSTCQILAESRNMSTVDCAGSIEGAIYIILLKITDVTGRFTQTNVTIAFTPANEAEISLTSSKLIFNPSDEITITGNISSNLSYFAYWSVGQEGVISDDLAILAVTPINATFLRPSSISSTRISRQIYLRLRAGSLAERNTYLFTLSCDEIVSSVTSTSYATLEVSINGRPTPGSFVVDPSQGLPLNTSFSFIATNWVDDDLPITYRFFIVEPTSGSPLILSSR